MEGAAVNFKKGRKGRKNLSPIHSILKVLFYNWRMKRKKAFRYCRRI